MLYDPKWEKTLKVKTNPISIAGLIEWLEEQNPKTRYSYTSPTDCLLARYFRAKGYRWALVGPHDFFYSRFFLPPLFSKSIPEAMNDVAYARTYGAALERARTAAATPA